MEQIRNIFLVFQSLAVCVGCFPNLSRVSIVAADQVESVDEKGGQVEGVGYVLETEVLCQSLD